MGEGKFGEPWHRHSFENGVLCDKHGLVAVEMWRFKNRPDIDTQNRIADCVSALAGIDDPAAYIKALEMDKRRLDWLDAQGPDVVDHPWSGADMWGIESGRFQHTSDWLREAIDAAMAGEAEGDGAS